RVGKNPRLRMVEDFSRPAPPKADPDDLLSTSRLPMAGSRPRPSAGHSRGPVAPEPPLPPEPSAPPTATSPEMPAVIAERHRMFTEERNLLEDAWSRRRMLAVAGAVALVGLACFALGVWKFSQPPEVDSDPKLDAVTGAVQEYLQTPPPAAVTSLEPTPILPPAPPPPAVAPIEPPPASSLEPAPDSKSNLAWISLHANRPARAYIDGVRVKRSLPLVHYPIKPGVREITLETLRAPRQREVFQVQLSRGEHKKLEQLFTSPRRR
ncbi:MAG: hypothetical protein ABW123_04975, partial [Cystobacter sp.]